MLFNDLLDNSALLLTVCSVVVLTTLILAVVAAKTTERRIITPITVLFVFIAIHILGGYCLAYGSSDQIGRAGAAMEPYYNKALAIFSLGAAAMFTGYAFSPFRMTQRTMEVLQSFGTLISVAELRRRSRFLVVFSVLLAIFGLMGIGRVPLFTDPAHRYQDIFNPSYGWIGFVINRSRELIQVPTALLLLLVLRRENVAVNFTFAAVGLFASILTATRTPLADVLLIVALVILMRRKLLAFGLSGAFLVLAYVGTQLMIQDRTSDELGTAMASGAGGGLPEVRDFAHVIANDLEPHWGLTFVVAALPIPGFISDFTKSNGLRTVTLKAVGIPLDAPHGGLRLTCIGELYLNWRMPGVIIGGLLIGMFYAWFGGALTLASDHRDVRLECLIASIWMLISFEFYLSGTGVAGMIKVLSGMLLLLYYVPRSQRQPNPVLCPVEG